MMSENRTKTASNIVRNTTKVAQSSYDLHSKKFLMGSDTPTNMSDMSDWSENKREITVSEGLDFMLWHFEEPLFPRNVSTAATRDGQKPVYGKDRAALFFQGSLMRQDCKIAVYPNYEQMVIDGFYAPGYCPKPTHLFIDLDLATFGGDMHKLDLVLKATLRNISRELNGAIPTVLWSGGGLHIHQPLDAAILPIFEKVPEFKRYKNPSVQFMRYAERRLTGLKSDDNHNISFKSSMARVPGSVNSKYSGDIANVRIIQRWNGVRAKPTLKFMFTDFLIWLAEADIESLKKFRKMKHYNDSSSGAGNTIGWIEKILADTPIDDHRKLVVGLILSRYLTNVKKLGGNEASAIIWQWLDKCEQLRRLEPSRHYFDREVVSRQLEQAWQSKIWPMRIDTMLQKYPDLYKKLIQGGA